MHFASIGVEHLTLESTRAERDRSIAVDLTGSFLIIQAAGKVMVQAENGRIVSMSSVAGIRGGTARAACGASKAGVAAPTRVTALEWAGRGVTVNAWASGLIDTALVQAMHDAETRRAYLQSVPMERNETPQVVAAAAVYQALPDSRCITGTTLSVEGGFVSSSVVKQAGAGGTLGGV